MYGKNFYINEQNIDRRYNKYYILVLHGDTFIYTQKFFNRKIENLNIVRKCINS